MLNSVGREQQFAIGSKVLEVVKEYICLGHLVTANHGHGSEMARRLRISAFGRYSQVMNVFTSIPLREKCITAVS